MNNRFALLVALPLTLPALLGQAVEGEVSPIETCDYTMVLIEPGEFLMGSPDGERRRHVDELQHPVVMTRPYEIGATEVTLRLYEQVMGQRPEDLEAYERPLSGVSWYGAIVFCNELSKLEGLDPVYEITEDTVTWDDDANGYRLPTEAEWEYAARAGGQTRYAGSDKIDKVAWHRGNAGRYHRGVAQLDPNAWGLFDMCGNMWEWCWDGYHPYPTDTETDPVRSPDGRYRIARGGSYVSSECSGVRVADRGRYDAGAQYRDLGFRLARTR